MHNICQSFRMHVYTEIKMNEEEDSQSLNVAVLIFCSCKKLRKSLELPTLDA